MKYTTGTQTTEGYIPHLIIDGIRCPVKLDFTHDPYMRDTLHPPLRKFGRLLFASPGGGEHLLAGYK